MKKLAVYSMIVTGAFFLFSQTVRAQEAAKKTAGIAVAEMKVGTDVQNKELVGADSTFPVNSKVYVWMRVTGGNGDSVVVTWKHGDKENSLTVGIGSNSWRTWAYKTVTASGEWSVTASSTAGEVLKQVDFTVK